MAAKSVNVRYERMSNVAPRALAIESESESDIKNNPQTPAPNGAHKNGTGANQSQKKGKRTMEQIRSALGVDRLKWWDEFWKVYPCHLGEKPGMDNFERIVKDRDTAKSVYQGARRYAARVAAELIANPTFNVKYAQGWLTDERWRDEGGASQRQLPIGTDPNSLDGYTEFK